ncbi:neutral zinc metallopeptidase [Amaricoccus sp.]|uniref:KPN_02809 family neutral zinc metallopeptidase n=1 Tax=Amaricoccus sp. TaxID=1872485 RepID=UPI001B57A3A0|nr:neutral zinc metallopeptidase [Amaricoccus sp.]MBP7242679.1 neutral zinc metallopeptidase [Amaricoccus sp.]
MDWRGRRMSDNVEDRRRGGGMVRAGGVGGLGLIVVLLIGVLFGVDVTPFLGGGVSTQAPSGPNEIEDDREAFVATVLAGTEDVWRPIFQQSGLTYHDPKLVLYRGVDRSACGAADAAMGPFYCPNDQTVYLDLDFFQVLEQQMGAGGEFAAAYVIAHEVGHHVQNELGTLGQVHQARSRMSARDSNALSVRTELQADCYAGMWAQGARDIFNVDRQDVAEAMNAAARIGDDALQRASQGVVVPDSFTHGSSQQRQTWFARGFETGDPNQCDTFQAGVL